MTEDEAGRLKPGDKIKLLKKDWLTDQGLDNIVEVLDPPLYITIDANFESKTLIRYFKLLNKVDNVGVTSCVAPEDCELASLASKKCCCDIMKLMTAGCSCGGV